MTDGGTTLYERFFKILPTMLGTADFDGRFSELNQAWETQLGYSAAEMAGKPCLDFVHPDERARFSEMLKKLLAGEGQATTETRFLSKDGSSKWLFMRWAPDREKKLLYYAATDVTARKLTEDALRESESTLHKIIDRAPMSMAIVNMDGAIEYINRKAEETFGYPHADIPDMDRWWALAYPDMDYRKEVSARWMSRVQDAFRKKSEIDGGEYLVTCKDGSKKICYIFGVIAAGKVFVMFDDITHRAEAEEAVRESAKTLRRVLEQAPIGIVIHGLDGKFEFINRKFIETFGYKPEDIPNLESWARQAYPEERYREELLDFWREATEKSMRTGLEIESGEYRVVCKNGSVKNILISGIVTADKKVVSLLEDVTARIQTEKALRESESLYRALIETTATGYVVIDGQGKVIDANREYVRLSGHADLKEIMGRNVVDWTAPGEKEKNAKAVAQCARDGHIWNFEIDYIDKTGKLTPVEVNATVVTRGGVPQILTLCRDVTRRRQRLEEIRRLNQGLEKIVAERTAELTAANRELLAEIEQRREAEKARVQLQAELLQSQKMELVGTLAGGIAHDFNNILVAISGYAEYLIKSMPEDAPAKGDLNEIIYETERGATLTRQLTAISRKQPSQPEVLDLNKVVEGAGKMLQRLIGSNMHLEMRLSSAIDKIKADPGQISQVIMNLVVNARDAMPDGGTITVETANAEITGKAGGKRLAPAPGQYVKLTVKDTGCGMSGEILSRLFEPFFTTKEMGKGTGLGLSIISGIVSQARGGIDVESAPGRGTTFTIYLPRTLERE